MNTINSRDQINLDVVDMSWDVIQASETKTIYNEVATKEFSDKVDCMLCNFDDMTPETYEGYLAPYTPLNKRKQALENAFDFGDTVIQMQTIGELTSNEVVVQATIYIMTEKGYEPWFSRFGSSQAMIDDPNGTIAKAETSAMRRILCALGMGDSSDSEIATIKDEDQRVWIKGYLDAKQTDFINLINDFNSKSEKPSIRVKTLDQVSGADLINLAEHINVIYS